MFEFSFSPIMNEKYEKYVFTMVGAFFKPT